MSTLAPNVEMFHRGSKEGEMAATIGNLFRVIFLATVFNLILKLPQVA